MLFLVGNSHQYSAFFIICIYIYYSIILDINGDLEDEIEKYKNKWRELTLYLMIEERK